MVYVCGYCSANNQRGIAGCTKCGSTLHGNMPLGTGLLPSQSLLHDGRYMLVRKVGQGGMGAVYKALDMLLNQRVVALKEMRQDGLSGQDLQEAISAFAHEAEILAHLNHPGLPHVYEQFEEGGRRYLGMEFIEGETLEQCLETVHAQEKLLPLAQIFAIAQKLCNVLEYLHMQQPPIVFRDLKPSNIMLGAKGRVYLIDFGIARLFKPGQAKDTVALGSQGYAPPEQYHQATSPRSDIYSLGATLHYMLTGDDPTQNPFRFQAFSLGMPQLEDLIMSMVALDHEQRPLCIRDVLRTLNTITSAQKTRISLKNAVIPAGLAQSSMSCSPITICAVLSPAMLDYELWVSLREQLVSCIKAFPHVVIKEVIAGKQNIHEQEKAMDQANFVLLLLSADFLASPACMNATNRALDRYKAQEIAILPVLLRRCLLTGRLVHITPIPEDAVAHRSLYAQEQRILDVVKIIRKRLAALVLAGDTTGPMNLLQWLLWQLYGDGRISSPYFVVGSYALQYIRPSGLASILLHLLDLPKSRTVAEYIINSHDPLTFAHLLQAIAPSSTDPEMVQGIALRDRPLEYVTS